MPLFKTAYMDLGDVAAGVAFRGTEAFVIIDRAALVGGGKLGNLVLQAQ